MLSVMQISYDEDSCEYSVDEFSTQCNQCASIHEELESIATPKCSKSRDSEILDEYSVDDDFTVEVYAASQGRDQSTDKVEHAIPVPGNATPSRGDPSEGHSQSHVLATKEEHEDEYIGDIDATTLANHSLVCESNKHPPTDARTQSNVLSHHDHMPSTKRTASFVPRCAYAEIKSMKYKKAGDLHSTEPKSTKVSHYSLERLTELSKPVEHRSYHSNNENGYAMMIKPKKTSLDSSASRSSFLERMERKEEERREKLQLAIARAVYDAKVDKVISCAILDSPRSAYSLIDFLSSQFHGEECLP